MAPLTPTQLATYAVKNFRTKLIRAAIIPVPPAGTLLAPLAQVPNPFRPQKNHESGRWAPPALSLRRQAELIKRAKLAGLLDLLPPGPKMLAPPPAVTNARMKLRADAEAELQAVVRAEIEKKAQARREVELEEKRKEDQHKADLRALETAARRSRHALLLVRARLQDRLEKEEAEALAAQQAAEMRANDPAVIRAAKHAAREAEKAAAKAAEELAKPRVLKWKEDFDWTTDARTERSRPGPTVGPAARLYAGKKRMFKGHKWERVRARIAAHRRDLMRDMPKRVERYRKYYARRRPNPLKPSTTSKQPKLPF